MNVRTMTATEIYPMLNHPIRLFTAAAHAPIDLTIDEALDAARNLQLAVMEVGAIRMRPVPKSYDGGDVNSHGNWYGEQMSCLVCRTTNHIGMSALPTYHVALHCGECGEVFAETPA